MNYRLLKKDLDIWSFFQKRHWNRVFINDERRRKVESERRCVASGACRKSTIYCDRAKNKIPLKKDKVQNKIIHLTLNVTEYALTAALARNRHPRGTSNIPLNAARCARLTWFGAIDCTRPIRHHDYTRRRPHTVSPRIGNHPYCSGL